MYIDGIPCGGITGGVSDRCLPGDHHVPVVGHHPIAEVGRGEGGGLHGESSVEDIRRCTLRPEVTLYLGNRNMTRLLMNAYLRHSR